MKDTLLTQLRFCTKLPSLPSIAMKIIDLAGKADTNLNQVGHYISLDPALAIKIIKSANSPLYKSRHQINNISQAVNILGMHGVMTIALSFSLTDSLMKQSGNMLSQSKNGLFWRRSITSALACRALGNRLGMDRLLDDLFLAALLQDIGMLAFCALLPDDYLATIATANDHDEVYNMERDKFGLGHDELGAALLAYWKLPGYIIEACEHSHHMAGSNQPGIKECVAASGSIAEYFLTPGDETKIITAINAIDSNLGFDKLALMEVLEDMKNELQHVEELFAISILSSGQLNSIVDEARELLTTRTLVKIHELENKVQHDGLTGAYNRSYFDDALCSEFLFSYQQETPLSLAMIDIDHFKIVNDTYGHIAGDGILVAIVKAISAKIRQTDLLCRYGGEEFALILPGTSVNDARHLLARVQENIEAIAYKLDSGHIIKVTASIGLAVNMDREKSFENSRKMLEAADCALYKAKHAGRNQIVQWNPAMVSHSQQP
ncbi:MAG: HDOD domain-containing protein [Nitrosomonas sp.]|nr:HDOD domain-containing protein [Nitrosomonas sp.]